MLPDPGAKPLRVPEGPAPEQLSAKVSLWQDLDVSSTVTYIEGILNIIHLISKLGEIHFNDTVFLLGRPKLELRGPPRKRFLRKYLKISVVTPERSNPEVDLVFFSYRDCESAWSQLGGLSACPSAVCQRKGWLQGKMVGIFWERTL